MLKKAKIWAKRKKIAAQKSIFKHCHQSGIMETYKLPEYVLQARKYVESGRFMEGIELLIKNMQSKRRDFLYDLCCDIALIRIAERATKDGMEMDDAENDTDRDTELVGMYFRKHGACEPHQEYAVMPESLDNIYGGLFQEMMEKEDSEGLERITKEWQAIHGYFLQKMADEIESALSK